MITSLYEECKPRTVAESVVAFGSVFAFNVGRMLVLRAVLRRMR